MMSIRSFKLAALVAVLALWLAVNNNFLPSPQKLIESWFPKQASEGTRKQMPDPAKKRADIEKTILSQPVRIIGEDCSPHTGHCYIVKDYVRRVGKRIVASRMMVLKKMPQYIFTQIDLSTPETLSWENHNVRHWPINKLIVDSKYCQLQISAGFITEAMSFSSTEMQQVLMIGLGGGVSSNFMSMLQEMDIQVETTVVEIDPFITQLAEKYFGHSHVEGVNNVVIQDGIKFVEEAVKKGTKYRSLLLDACYNYDETDTGLLCPIKPFLTDEVIKNMYDVLEDGGVVSVNTISDRNAFNHEAEAMEMFGRHFPSCYLAPYQNVRNMLICSKKENWTWHEQQERFRKNLKEVMERFDFTDLSDLLNY